MGKSSGGSQNITQSSVVQLPDWANQFARNTLESAYHRSLQPYEAYTGQRISEFSPQQKQALGLAEQTALNNQVTKGQVGLTTDTLAGKYLDPTKNPLFDPTLQRLQDAYRTGTAASTNAAFSQAGAFGGGSSAYDQYSAQQGRAYGDSIANLAGELYNKERENQIRTLALAPQANAAQYADIQQLMGVGDIYRQQEQDKLNLAYQDWLEQKNYPWTQSERFANLIPALLGNSQVSTQTGPNPYQSSKLANAVGGGLLGGTAGYSLGSALGSASGSALAGAGEGAMTGGAYGGYGAAVGALLGALGSMYF